MEPELLVGRVFGVSPAGLDDSASNRTLEAWDSLGHLALITEVQAEYGIELSAEDILSMTSLAHIKRVLTARGIRW